MARRRRRRNVSAWTPVDELGKFYVIAASDEEDGVCETQNEAIEYAKNAWLDNDYDSFLVLRVVKVYRNQKLLAEENPPTPTT